MSALRRTGFPRIQWTRRTAAPVSTISWRVSRSRSVHHSYTRSINPQKSRPGVNAEVIANANLLLGGGMA
jgi:hypothetical protein